MASRNEMDTVWLELIQQSKKGKSFTLAWYEDHVITKELLKSDILEGLVLDIGCGLGSRTFLASKKCAVIGIDFSQVAIDYAIKHFGSRFCIADAVMMPFRNQAFDNAFLLATIEHIKDLKTLISEISRILKPLGKLFVSVTSEDYHKHSSHIHRFTKFSLATIFKPFVVLKSYIKEHIIFMVVQF